MRQKPNKQAENLAEQEPEILADQEAVAPDGEEQELSLEEAAAKLAKAYAELESQKLELDGQMLRLQADFDNFRRRTRTEKEEWRAQIVADFCGDILPVIDNFKRAYDAMDAAGDASQHLAGIHMIARQLSEVMANRGVELIPTVGEDFDPKWHEAIGQVAIEDEAQIGKVMDEIQAGYKVGDKPIRVAMVRVGAK